MSYLVARPRLGGYIVHLGAPFLALILVTTGGLVGVSSTRAALLSTTNALPDNAYSRYAEQSSLPIGVFTVNVGSSPAGEAYDTSTGLLYVANYGSNSVSIIDRTQVVRTVGTGSGPYVCTFDPANGDIYVSNYGSNNLTIINGSARVGSVNVGTNPLGAAFDVQNGLLYVGNDASSSLTIVNGTKVVSTLTTGSNPQYITYDDSNGFVYAIDSGSGAVTVVNGTKVISTVAVGSGPGRALVDPKSGLLYVTNSQSATVSIINGTKVVATVSVGNDPTALAYDSKNSKIYVANFLSGNISVLKGLRVVGVITGGSQPSDVVYDGGDDSLYVTNLGSSNVSVIENDKVVTWLVVGTAPNLETYDATNGYVYFGDSGSAQLSVVSTWPDVTAAESGLPLGADWWVNLTGGPSLFSMDLVATMAVPDGTYSFVVATSDKSYTAPGGVFSINGSDVEITIEFHPVVYSILFVESGLVPGVKWSVSLGGFTNDSTSNRLGFGEMNGTFSYSIRPLSGWSASPSTGSLSVNGRVLEVNVTWSRVTYAISFVATGLPPGTSWWVNLSGNLSNSTSVPNLFVRAGNGSYTYAASTADTTYGTVEGNFAVDGAPEVETVKFLKNAYPIRFVENGLPAGALWGVNVSNLGSFYSVAPSILVESPNTTESYSVMSADPTFAAVGGVVTVDGGPVIQNVSFDRVTYSVTFYELGLTTGTNWTLQFNGSVYSVRGSISLPGFVNGSFGYSIGYIRGFSPTPDSGVVKIAGEPTTESIHFVPITSGNHGNGGTVLGLTTMGSSLALGAAIGAFGSAIGLAVLRRRTRPSLAPRERPPGPRSRNEPPDRR